MPTTITIPGVYVVATAELAIEPVFTAEQWKVVQTDGSSANLAALPLARTSQSVIDVVVSDGENQSGASVVFEDSTGAWLGPTIILPVTDSATAAAQDSIKALLAAGATVRVPLSEDGKRMDLILGDHHSDQVMLWTVEIDYQNDFTGVLTITDRFDKSIVHKRVPVSVLSATQVAAPFTAEFDSDIGLCGSPQVAHLRFALTMIEDIGGGEFNETTPQLGDCFVKARGTTSA